MDNPCENITGTDKSTCSDYYNCCDCGITDGNGCGCAYCWSCNACETCLESED